MTLSKEAATGCTTKGTLRRIMLMPCLEELLTGGQGCPSIGSDSQLRDATRKCKSRPAAEAGN